MGHVASGCFGLRLYQRRPVHQAAQDRNVHMLLLLVKYGADPQQKDSRGKTAYDYVSWPASFCLCFRVRTFLGTGGFWQ